MSKILEFIEEAKKRILEHRPDIKEITFKKIIGSKYVPREYMMICSFNENFYIMASDIDIPDIKEEQILPDENVIIDNELAYQILYLGEFQNE